MKHLILFFIIILGIVLINCLSYQNREDFKEIALDYEPPMTDIKQSKIGHRGVFANKNYKKGQVLEVCPCIKQDHDLVSGRISDYLFGLNDKESLIAFGYCSMYNHIENPNATWTIVNENQIKIEATRDIKKGEEIFISYGDSYWEERDAVKNDVDPDVTRKEEPNGTESENEEPNGTESENEEPNGTESENEEPESR
jgi:hypothetical protein